MMVYTKEEIIELVTLFNSEFSGVCLNNVRIDLSDYHYLCWNKQGWVCVQLKSSSNKKKEAKRTKLLRCNDMLPVSVHHLPRLANEMGYSFSLERSSTPELVTEKPSEILRLERFCKEKYGDVSVSVDSDGTYLMYDNGEIGLFAYDGTPLSFDANQDLSYELVVFLCERLKRNRLRLLVDRIVGGK